LRGYLPAPRRGRRRLPEFEPPDIQIQAEALGLSAQEVEQLITVPLEQDLLNGIPWVEHIRSRSMPGLSAIDLQFEPAPTCSRPTADPGADVAGQGAAERWHSADHDPAEVVDQRVAMVAMRSDSVPRCRCRCWPLADQASADEHSGVANVSIWVYEIGSCRSR
jgi:hypothetical protein